MVSSRPPAVMVEDGPAGLALEGRVVFGVVRAASPDLGCFVFLPAHSATPPALGALVRIRWGRSDGFRAEAEVLEIEDEDAWILSVPMALGPSAQRTAPRIGAEGDWLFETEDGETIDVRDISSTGLGLVFPRGEGPQERGIVLEGRLVYADGQSWSVQLVCTNVRPCSDSEHHWVVGTRMTLEDPTGRRALTLLLDALLRG